MDNSYYAIQTGSEQFVSLYSVFHDLKRHLVQEQFWNEDTSVCYENNKMTAIKLIQAFQCSNIPKLFIAKKRSNSVVFPQLATDQISTQKTVDRYLSGFTKPYNSHDRYFFGVPSSLNGLEQQAENIYFEINDLIALLDRQSIPHPFRISVPKIPILPGDAEDPQTNLIYKKPARLRSCQDGPSFINIGLITKIRNKEGEKTTLTEYLEYPRWTPAMAAMLTCGLRPQIGTDHIPDEAAGLWYRGDVKVNSNNCIFFKHAKELLGSWQLQKPFINSVTPNDWITWCGEQGMECYWLRDIPLADAWIKHFEAQAEEKDNIPPEERCFAKWKSPPSCSIPETPEAAPAPAALPQEDDPVKWTWPVMEKFTKLSRKTIINRAGGLEIEFDTKPAKRGRVLEKGLRESDLRRIINYKKNLPAIPT